MHRILYSLDILHRSVMHSFTIDYSYLCLVIVLFWIEIPCVEFRFCFNLQINILFIRFTRFTIFRNIHFKCESDAVEYEPTFNINGYKTILAYNIPSWLNFESGINVFTDLACPVNKCRLSTKHSERKTADLVVFHEHYVDTNCVRSPQQIYAFFHLEAPPYTSRIKYPGEFFQRLLHTGFPIEK